MNTLLFSYRDVDIYQRDAVLFNEGEWLNDSCLSYAFKRIEDKISAATSSEVLKSILLVDPSVVSFLQLQCGDDEEFEDLRISLESDSKTWILFPVSDNQGFDSSSSHWSTLLCHRPTSSLLHYDSLGGRNLDSAQRLASKISRLLSWSSNPSVMAYTGPQQSNGNDCGVYTALFCQLTCERVCRHQHEHLSTSTNNNNSQIDTLSLRSLGWLTDLTSAINPTNAYEFRRAMRADVSDATARFGHKRSSELLESIRLSSSSGSSSGQVSDDNSFHGVEFRPLLQSIVEGGVENDEDENNHLEDDVDEYGLDTLPHDV